MQFIDWVTLKTYAGAMAMNLVITQLTKNIKPIKRIPTQLWSYIIALGILYPAYMFTGELSFSNAILILFNGMIVALSANGGFDAIRRVVS